MIIRWYWLCVGRRWCDVVMFFAYGLRKAIFILLGGSISLYFVRNYDFFICDKWYSVADFFSSATYQTIFFVLGGPIAIHPAAEWELASGLDQCYGLQKDQLSC